MRQKHLGLWMVALVGFSVCQSVAADTPPAPPPARAVQVRAGPALKAASVAELGRQLEGLSRWVKRKQGRLSAQFVDVHDLVVLAKSNAELPLNPASNLKLLTAAAALDMLGPGRRFRTVVFGKIDRGAARHLTLKGDGDPDLRAEHLDALARRLAARGLKRISGDILVDVSAFDSEILPPGFGAQPKERAAFRAPVWALSVNRNAITVVVTPSAGGAPAQVTTSPDGVVVVQGSVATGAAGSGQKVRLALQRRAGRVVAQMGGSIATGLPAQRFRRRVADPKLWAGLVFAESLRRAGVQLRGRVRSGNGPTQVLEVHESAPVRVLVHALGKDSDNFAAEMLLKRLGAHTKGRPGTSAAGAAAALSYAKRLGVPAAQVQIRNGSGLFDGGRASANALTRLLAGAYGTPRVGPEFLAQLSIGGVDGTLRSRFRKHASARRIRAKTGTLARVIALSGYVLSKDGRGAVAFSILVEGARASHAEIRSRIDRVVEHALGN